MTDYIIAAIDGWVFGEYNFGMTIHFVSSLAEPVGKLWQKLQAESGPDFFVASPLSSTPLPVYDWVVRHAQEFTEWSRVGFVLMDEQVEVLEKPYRYVDQWDPASYEGFARKHFLDPLRDKTGVSVDVCKPELSSIGYFNSRIDLLVLALGVRGNYANVMPGTQETVGWHVAQLIPEFRQSHTGQGSRSYENAHFREFGMSLGPQQVLTAKNIAVIISGENKRSLAEQLLSYKGFDPEFPLSIIFHKEVVGRVQVFIQEDVGILPASSPAAASPATGGAA